MGGKGELKTIRMDPKIFNNCPNYTKNHPYSHVFFKLHIFNPELFPYEKVCFIDSDLVPLNYYDSLFMLDCPAGFIEYRKKIPYLEAFNWDRCDFLEHGKLIPKELTDIDKPTGADINAGLLLVKPDKKEFDSMIKELTSPLNTWMGPNHKHKGFFTFNFENPDGREFIKNSYCYPEQNYLTKRFSGKWNYIEFAFQSWSRDPCNSFGIHMAAFNPKPWFKQPIGSSISINKKYDPYSENWDIKKIRIPIAIKEDTKSSYENISYSYEIFNEVIIWGLTNYPDLQKFFSRDIELHGTKVSFDRDVFKKISKNKQFIKLEDIDKGSAIYKRLSISQRTICNLLNNYKKYKKKTKNNYKQICRSKKSRQKNNYTIIDYPGHKKKNKKTKKKELIDFGKYKGELIKDLNKGQVEDIIKTKKYKSNKKIKRLFKKYHNDIINNKNNIDTHTNGYTLFYFYMEGCKYCLDFNTIWDKLIITNKGRKDITFKKLNKDNDKYNILSKVNITPTFPFLVLVKGDELIPFPNNDKNKRTIKRINDFIDEHITVNTE